MEKAELFGGISRQSIDAMIDCFKPELRSFKKGDTILVYSTELEYLCVLLEGKAHLYCMDSDGEYTLLEQVPGFSCFKITEPYTVRYVICSTFVTEH